MAFTETSLPLQYIIFNSLHYNLIMKVTFRGFQINTEPPACEHVIKSNSDYKAERCLYRSSKMAESRRL
jgi:hypothetical protein